ncbi:uncharacterized protein B0T15DRAFT_396189 [Chaetomium strumarium]|uniref:Protein kinase domain-containing protein n=1 Tax=Chaetomium strumarium TaxID=1170767 RepID=A0AAJ0GS73_9PEZI|nr:hypothetical protein B0T15DRAFT_396189 [Chaetomium strumarium]
MQDLETLRRGGYRNAGLTEFTLRCPLATFPEEILELGDTLKMLDLCETGLATLPATLGSALPNLETACFTNCNFTVFPEAALGSCPNLVSVAFQNNEMEEIPEDALCPSLVDIDLTDNCLTRLPSTIGRCVRLETCYFGGNQLQDLPPEMAQCGALRELRLSFNRLSALPPWLFELRNLTHLSFARNPYVLGISNGVHTPPADIAWSDLDVTREQISDTFRGIWHQPHHGDREVSIKLFDDLATDVHGCPAAEMEAWVALQPCPTAARDSLPTVIGRIQGHPEEDRTTFHGGIVTEPIPDRFWLSRMIPTRRALQMLTGLANAMAHLHARGIAHGHVVSECIFANTGDAHAVLGNFSSSTVYGLGLPQGQRRSIEKLEVRAFGLLIEKLRRHLDVRDEPAVWIALGGLQSLCANQPVNDRPTFARVVEWLEEMRS